MSTPDTSSAKNARTPLYDIHINLGAKMAPFGGYDMPIQYSGIIEEHQATRTACTIFDTCHMGEFLFSGKTAIPDLEKILTCRINNLEIGQCRYGFICNEQGGVIDDQIIYRMGDDSFFMVVNASTSNYDFEWITSRISANTSARNASSETGKVDLQGPHSPKIMQKLMGEPISDMKYYRWKHNTYRSQKVLISRTGYTGEIGFEIYCDTNQIKNFFNDCIECGAKPAGLGARDTLRLEMGLPLYGHELNASRNPMESGYTRSIDSSKQFIGSSIVCNPENVHEILVGLVLKTRRASRAGDTILDINGNKIGTVTSGSFSPSLETAIALGYIKKENSTSETAVHVNNGRQQLDAEIASLPFYKKATGRKNLSDFI